MGCQTWPLGGETWTRPTVSGEWPFNRVVQIETLNKIPKGSLVHLSAGGDLVGTYEGDPKAIGRVIGFQEGWNDGRMERIATVQMF